MGLLGVLATNFGLVARRTQRSGRLKKACSASFARRSGGTHLQHVKSDSVPPGCRRGCAQSCIPCVLSYLLSLTWYVSGTRWFASALITGPNMGYRRCFRFRSRGPRTNSNALTLRRCFLNPGPALRWTHVPNTVANQSPSVPGVFPATGSKL